MGAHSPRPAAADDNPYDDDKISKSASHKKQRTLSPHAGRRLLTVALVVVAIVVIKLIADARQVSQYVSARLYCLGKPENHNNFDRCNAVAKTATDGIPTLTGWVILLMIVWIAHTLLRSTFSPKYRIYKALLSNIAWLIITAITAVTTLIWLLYVLI